VNPETGEIVHLYAIELLRPNGSDVTEVKKPDAPVAECGERVGKKDDRL